MPNLILNVSNQRLDIVQNFSPIVANSINYLFFQIRGLVNKDWLGYSSAESFGDTPKQPLTRFVEFSWKNTRLVKKLPDYIDTEKDRHTTEQRERRIEEWKRKEEQECYNVPSWVIRTPGFSVSVFAVALSSEEREKLGNDFIELKDVGSEIVKRITTNVQKFDVVSSGALVIGDDQIEKEYMSGEFGPSIVEIHTLVNNNTILIKEVKDNIGELAEKDNQIYEEIKNLKDKDSSLDEEIKNLKDKGLSLDEEIKNLKDKDSSLDEEIKNLTTLLDNESISRSQEDEKIYAELSTSNQNIEILSNLFDWDVEFDILKNVQFYVGDFSLETKDFIQTIVSKRFSEYIPITNVRYSSNKRGYELVFFLKEDEKYTFLAYAPVPEDASLSEIAHFTPPTEATHFVVCKKDSDISLKIQAEINYRTHKIAFKEDLAGATKKIVDDIIGKALYQDY